MARNPDEDYEFGEEVEVFTNDEWEPGSIVGIYSYTIYDIGYDEYHVVVMPSDIRNPRTRVRRQNRYLMVDSPIEFRENGVWYPGILTHKNYSVRMHFYGRNSIDIFEHDDIRRVPTEEEIRARAQHWAEIHAAPQPVPVVQPRGIAYEVHNAFADLNLPKFMTIIRRENNGASNFKDNNNVLEPIVSYINGPDTTLSSEQKTRYTRNIRDSIRQNVSAYIEEHPDLEDNTLEVIQFVLSQDPKYKDLYIETFENECMGGYSTGNRQSCTKGMFERIYMANKGTIQGLCFDEIQGTSSAAATAATVANACNPVYLELYDTFVPGADIDINDIFQKWYNQFSYDAIPEEENPLRTLSIEERKQHFRDFVRQDAAISQRMWTNVDFQSKMERSIQKNNIIFETLTIDVGLGKRKRRRNTAKKKQRKVTMKKQRRVRKRKTKGKY